MKLTNMYVIIYLNSMKYYTIILKNIYIILLHQVTEDYTSKDHLHGPCRCFILAHPW